MSCQQMTLILYGVQPTALDRVVGHMAHLWGKYLRMEIDIESFIYFNRLAFQLLKKNTEFKQLTFW